MMLLARRRRSQPSIRRRLRAKASAVRDSAKVGKFDLDRVLRTSKLRIGRKFEPDQRFGAPDLRIGRKFDLCSSPAGPSPAAARQLGLLPMISDRALKII
jgi:hypothetical protein